MHVFWRSMKGAYHFKFNTLDDFTSQMSTKQRRYMKIKDESRIDLVFESLLSTLSSNLKIASERGLKFHVTLTKTDHAIRRMFILFSLLFQVSHYKAV